MRNVKYWELKVQVQISLFILGVEFELVFPCLSLYCNIKGKC